MKHTKTFEKFELTEGPEKGNQKFVTSDRPKVAPAPQAMRRKQPTVVFDEFENELRDLIDGYSIFLSQEEMKDIINKVI